MYWALGRLLRACCLGQNRLFEDGIEVPIKAIEGKLYVRLSAHVHNELSDYEALRECVLRL